MDDFIIGERYAEVFLNPGRRHLREINGTRFCFVRTPTKISVERRSNLTGEYIPVHEWTFPETRTHLAANGHRMTYTVTGYDADGEPRLSQWDAVHADDCPCLRSEGYDPFGLPDW
ncbi:hypothetical protein [Streptomyces johnsoniae]|uniref:Uncharacterized protein n=1 Tax=Streptomyces johnsoniae TaxID=3075532 RepID=A0ABU2RZW6_9ACTN|nr:hypothetical protein [Streptomyces sp. DSM 41886]MDT0442307.1 hypothetical protein [Streptomyces sp. DSM 41886]